MQAIAIGLSKMAGTSKGTGNQYEMHRLTIIIPNKNVSSAKFNKFGLGFEPMDLPVAESAFAKLGSITYPCRIDLTMDHEPRAGKVEAVVAGFTGQPVFIDMTMPAAAKPAA